MEELAVSMVMPKTRENAMTKILAGKVPADLSLELDEDDAVEQVGNAGDECVTGAMPLVTAESPEVHTREWL